MKLTHFLSIVFAAELKTNLSLLTLSTLATTRNVLQFCLTDKVIEFQMILIDKVCERFLKEKIRSLLNREHD